jgi:cytochrome P450/NADPH-cytochrome P450 reductase
LTDTTLADKGAHRLAPIGLTDVSKGNIFGDFDDWLDTQFFPAVGSTSTSQADTVTNVEISTSARASSLRHDISLGKVKSIRKLTADGEPVKLHMEVQLPSNSTYECGDYLAVLPMNPDKIVRRVLAHFQLPWDATIILKEGAHSSLPTGSELSVYDVLRSYVELSQPATKKVSSMFHFIYSRADNCRT